MTVFYKIGDPLPDTLSHSPFKACVVPRPIAWISTISSEGICNIAPFSYFNAVADTPPIIMFSCSAKSDGQEKDTMRNVLATGDFVINLVSRKHCSKMVASSKPLAYNISEAEECDIAISPSALVNSPKISESYVSMECKFLRDIRVEDANYKYAGSTMILGEVVGISLSDEVILDGKVDSGKLDVVTRLGYDQYGTIGDIFRSPKMF